MSLSSRLSAEKPTKNAGNVPRVLATDLDGTLIPLAGSDANRRDLRILTDQLNEHEVTLTFVTGRHLEIVETAIDLYDLPRPEWMICDVGSTIYRDSPQGWQKVAEYHDHLASLCTGLSVSDLRQRLDRFKDLALQPDEKQGPFKLSFDVDSRRLDHVAADVADWLTAHEAPWSLIASVDPFTGGGLLDLLPRGVSKAYALDWWRSQCGFDRMQVVFAGDSGNDWAALIAGYRSIVVGNADRQLADRIASHHQQKGWSDRLYLAQETATSGVLAGCRAFGLIPK